MTPFQVYLLLQMDRIVGALLALAVLGIVVALLCTAFGSIEDEPGPRIFGRRAFVTSIFLWVAFMFAPSTSTVAAMVVLPKLTSPQALDAMGKEGQELYGIVKDALRKLADDKPKDAR